MGLQILAKLPSQTASAKTGWERKWVLSPIFLMKQRDSDQREDSYQAQEQRINF